MATINKLKYATVSDIGVYNLICYEENKKKELIKFCEQNGISFIPSANKKSIFELQNGKFINKEIDETYKVNPYDRIFESDTLAKFEKNSNEVRFIMENNRIKGVIHIVDYNNEFLQVELYRAIFRFECNLRTLLVNSGKTNEDFIGWVEEIIKNKTKKKDNEFWVKRLEVIRPKDEIKRKQAENKMKEASPFQTFYLSELMGFSKSLGIMKNEKINIDQIMKLRNHNAHGHHATTNNVNSEGEIIYNYKGLKDYIDWMKNFTEAYDYLEEELAQST